MLLAFMKKDILHLLRDKKEVILLIAMPFILITILGFALGTTMKEESGLNIAVGTVDHGDLFEQVDLFKEWMRNHNIPEAVIEQMAEAAEQSSLPEILVDEVMIEELPDLITVTEEENLSASLDSDEYAAVLFFPKNYRLEAWKHQFFEEEEGIEKFEIYLNEEKGLEANILSGIVENFTDQMRLYTVLAKESQMMNQSTPDFASLSAIQGEVATMEGEEPINSFEYFAIGMSVMFALYVVSFVASYAFQEKSTFVYNRILLANVSPFIYGTSKWISAVLVTFLQLCALFGLSKLIYNVSWPNLFSFLTITLMLSLAVGSITVLITAMNYRLETERVSTMFSGFLVSVLAFLGGSFIPWDGLSESMWKLGAFTPNGAAMQGYLHVLKGGALHEVSHHLWTLGVMSLLILLLAVSLFPKRRSI
ncbi:ABC transporter permease [Sutcliffiella deserti]|uniref:ABC transporter permease n=1 Tax=Sutcliffiella deserti TaxID=2875501 RepID=UPI001CBB5946|nr:ABC transporter permease [Sutcliffiella deserti]